MADLDLRLLRYFVAIAEQASFSAAAERLGVSQPALSQGLRRLEDVLGVELVGRAPRGSTRSLVLTEIGAVFLEDSRELLQHANRVVRKASEHSVRTYLRVGFGSSTPNHLLRALLKASEELPRVEVSLEFVGWGGEMAALERGDVSMVFLQTRSEIESGAVEGVRLLSMERLAVFNADHHLSSYPSISIYDMDREPIIDAAFDRDYWLAMPRPSGRLPNVVGPAARTVDEMLTLVAAGKGMAITSSTVAEKHRWPELRFVPIIDLPPAHVFFATLKSEKRKEVRQLLQTLAKNAGPPG
ncbi:LysR family transcriptional regulator [Shinella sp. CPCC 100929]|uniref:LysR family transcriptional regulator n=1 Tax=Shinella lacus TaxID=2654216 RepID=A0ABT1RBU0_9HYPH|nr:LysR family transcriptional regulator [Shinella lacus]MCQ4632654.1 LysR family transcriptional regulator [Shinella lacus]